MQIHCLHNDEMYEQHLADEIAGGNKGWQEHWLCEACGEEKKGVLCIGCAAGRQTL